MALDKGGHFTAILILGVVFVAIGLALALNVRGFGAGAVRLIFELGDRDVPGNHVRFFYVGWGIICEAFGSAAVLICLRVLT